MKTYSFVFMLLLGADMLTSCKKNSCYDAKLAEQYSAALCTADCPGVTGCDGNTYCNECMANQHGIRVK